MTMRNVEFSDAVRLAFEAFRPYANHFRLPQQQTALAPLLEYLRSDKEMLSGDREFLADLLGGELGRHRGRPQLRLAEKNRRHNICLQVIALEKEWRTAGRKWPFHDAAIEEVSTSLAKKPRLERATAEEIRGWFKGMTATRRALLEQEISRR